MKLTTIVLALVFAAACGKDSAKDGDTPSAESEEVADARKYLADMKTALAAGETSRVMAICSVEKSGWPKLEKANAALAAEIKKMCERDVRVAEMKRALEEAEAAVAKDPEGFNPECSSLSVYNKNLDQADPEVIELNKRWLAACPKAKP